MKMKNIAICLLISFMTLDGIAQKVEIQKADLSGKIRTYINTEYSKLSVIQAFKNKDEFTTTYYVLLENYTELEFNKKNEITRISGKIKLPDSVVPEIILTYIKNKYPKNVVIGWQLNEESQKIKLDSGLDLEFKRNGDFIRIVY